MAVQYGFSFVNFPFVGFCPLRTYFILFSMPPPPQHQGGRGPILTLVGVTSLQGRHVTLGTQELAGGGGRAGETSDCVEHVDTGLGGSWVSNPHPLYPSIGKREKKHQPWDNPWRPPLSRI